MNHAIVAGGNGLLGRALVLELSKYGLPVLVLGTSKEIHTNLKHLFQNKVKYIQTKINADWIINLRKEIKREKLDGSVFFNLAWRGSEKLNDGGISDQLKNISMSCEFVKLAGEVGVDKLIATGSMEEVIFHRQLSKYSLHARHVTNHWYGLAKTSAYMQSAFQAYLSRVDFCYTRVSTVIDKQLRTNKFVETSIRKILDSSEMPIPNNFELCNISSAEEIARQLVAVAQHGVNKKIYNLGTEYSDSLYGHFLNLAKIVASDNEKTTWDRSALPGLLRPDDFSLARLKEDTGYIPTESTLSLFSELAGKS